MHVNFWSGWLQIYISSTGSAMASTWRPCNRRLTSLWVHIIKDVCIWKHLYFLYADWLLNKLVTSTEQVFSPGFKLSGGPGDRVTFGQFGRPFSICQTWTSLFYKWTSFFLQMDFTFLQMDFTFYKWTSLFTNATWLLRSIFFGWTSAAEIY